MNKHQILSFLIIGMIIMSCSEKHTQSYTERYNLDFKFYPDTVSYYPWLINLTYTLSNIYDFTDSDSIRTVTFKKGTFIDRQFEIELAQRVLLPLAKNIDKGKVVFKGQGDGISRSYLIIDGLDFKEKILYSDTLRFDLNDNLESYAMEIPLENIELLNLKLYVEAEEDKDASVKFHKMDIFVGDKHIDEYAIRELPSNVKNLKSHVIPIELNTYNPFDKIDAIKDKKIIGLGESVHRNVCINNLVQQFILQKAEENYKLILVERPMERCLLFNRYIQEADFEINFDNSDDARLANLLRSLKQYNLQKSNKDKIKLYGIDYNLANPISNKRDNTAINLFDYITTVNKGLNNRELDQLAILLMDDDWQKAILFLDKEENKIMQSNILSREEYQSIKHILAVSYSMGVENDIRVIARDSVMFINTKFLMDNICKDDERVIIYAHSGHLNPVSTYPVVPCSPFGYYLKKEYQNNYVSLLLSIGAGNTLANIGAVGLDSRDLKSPPKGSIEYELNTFDTEISYLPLTSEFDRLMYSRFIGSHFAPNEFYPFNLYQRHEGILFIKNCVKSGDEQRNPMMQYIEKVSEMMENDTLSSEERRIENEKLFKEAMQEHIDAEEKINMKTKNRKALLESIIHRKH